MFHVHVKDTLNVIIFNIVQKVYVGIPFGSFREKWIDVDDGTEVKRNLFMYL